MRNILAFLGALVVTLVAVGWYENWFQVRTTPGPDGNRNISIDIDSKKVGDDITKTENKIETFLDEKTKEAKPTTSTAPATTPAKNFKAPAIELKDSPKDPKFELNLFGPPGKN
jgi:hypothetical protein